MIDAVDTAYAHDTYPTPVVLGYAGGHTTHVWTLAEVEHVRALGKKWLAIWTSVNLAPATLTAQLGAQDAGGMAAKLPTYGYAKTDPVFYDVEPGVYDRDPAGARAAIAAWKTGMHAEGYPRAYVYTVARQGGDWIVVLGDKPKSIPAGKIGVQYAWQPGFDFSVFDDSLLTTGDDMSAADVAAINSHTDDRIDGLVNDGTNSLSNIHDMIVNVEAHLTARIAALQSAVSQLGAGGAIDYGKVEAAAEAALAKLAVVVKP